MDRALVKFLRESDRVPDDETPLDLEPVDLTPILGGWRNARHDTTGIIRAELTDRDGRVWMRVWAADPATAQPHEWGEAEVERFYTTNPRSAQICGYTATFDLGHARTRIFVNMNHGVSVFGAVTTFTDGSGRHNYLSREFFHREGDHDRSGPRAR